MVNITEVPEHSGNENRIILKKLLINFNSHLNMIFLFHADKALKD